MVDVVEEVVVVEVFVGDEVVVEVDVFCFDLSAIHCSQLREPSSEVSEVSESKKSVKHERRD